MNQNHGDEEINVEKNDVRFVGSNQNREENEGKNEGEPLLDENDDDTKNTRRVNPKLESKSPKVRFVKKVEQFLIWMIFICQGMACLLPFNTYINCPDYFLRLYFSEVMSVIPSVYMLLNVSGMVVMTFLGDKFHRFINTTVYIVVPYIFFIISLACIPILGWIGLNKWVSFGITMVIVMGTGLSTAMLQGSIFGNAFRFPNQKINQGVMMGNGIVGILVSILRIITKVSVERKGTFEEYEISASLYFGIGSVTMILLMMSFFLMFLIPYGRDHLGLLECFNIPFLGNVFDRKNYEELNEEGEEENENEEGGEEQQQEHEKKKHGLLDGVIRFGWTWLYGFFLNWNYCFCVFLVFFATMSVFPGITSIIPTSFPNSFMKDWFGIIITTLFTLFDFVGRTLPGWYVLDCKKQLPFIVISRLLFIVLFMMCLHPVWWLHHDAFPFGLMVLMAFTNGYFSTLTTMFANGDEQHAKALRIAENSFGYKGKQAKEYSRKLTQVSGTIVTLFLVGGISFGSWFSMILNYTQQAIYK